MSHWQSYESCMRAAKRSRDYALYFAERKDWTRAFAHAETARTAQVKADEHFECRLDELALNDVPEHTCTSCLRPELDCSLNPCDAVEADRIS